MAGPEGDSEDSGNVIPLFVEGGPVQDLMALLSTTPEREEARFRTIQALMGRLDPETGEIIFPFTEEEETSILGDHSNMPDTWLEHMGIQFREMQQQRIDKGIADGQA